MAEGIEEAESNSGSSAGDATTMLSAAMPCEVRDFGAYHNQDIKRSVSITTNAKLNLSISKGKLLQQQQQRYYLKIDEFDEIDDFLVFSKLF